MCSILNAIIVVSLALGFGACSGTTNPTAPTASTSPRPTGTLISASIAGPATIVSGTSAQFKNTATYSDDSTKDVTRESTWSSSDPSLAIVNAGGMGTVTALHFGDVQISASYQNTNSSMRISVTPFFPPQQPFSNLQAGVGGLSLAVPKSTGTRIVKMLAGPTGAGAKYKVAPGLLQERSDGTSIVTWGLYQGEVTADVGGTAVIPVILQDQNMLKIFLVESPVPLAGVVDISGFINP